MMALRVRAYLQIHASLCLVNCSHNSASFASGSCWLLLCLVLAVSVLPTQPC
jgi:hypothetical protein